MIEVVESFVEGKYALEHRCEDAVVCTPHYVAVIDGATTERGHEIDGRAPGRFAAETLVSALHVLDPDADSFVAVRELSRALADALVVRGAAPGKLASACVLVASARRREIWRVGNSTYAVDGVPHPQRWDLAEIPARLRAAYLRGLLRAGASLPAEIARDDPAQRLIAPLLRIEHVFRNAVDAGELAFGAIDGLDIPPGFVELAAIPTGVDVVFASDGYPLVARTLEKTETYLRRSLAEDPFRIDRHPEVRGVGPGQVSYDDRAYLRFRLVDE